MDQYRLYLLSESGHITAGRDANCSDDDEAYERATNLLTSCNQVEIWHETRCVGRVYAPTLRRGPRQVD